MRKLLVLLIIVSSISTAQTYKSGWALGFSAISPRLMGDVPAEALDFGGGITINYDMDEANTFRLRSHYLMFTAKPSKFTNNAYAGGIDYLRKLVYCGDIHIYIGAGGSVYAFETKNSTNFRNDMIIGEVGAHIWLGGTYQIDSDLYLKAEMGNTTMSTDVFDGTRASGSGGLFGGSLDSYITLDLGILYYIDRGEESDICNLPSGSIKPTQQIQSPSQAMIDYDRIEDIVKRNSNDVNIDYNRIGDVVKRSVDDAFAANKAPLLKNIEESRANWVLVGINFESGASSIPSEAYPILANAAQILLTNPEIKVEIQGHTDNVGNASSNLALSRTRAEMVKAYLVSKGVAAGRITTAGFGDTRPIADNKSEQGRKLNRRIEFKVLNK